MSGKKKFIRDLSKLSEIKHSILGHRLVKVADELNVSIRTLTTFLRSKGKNIENNPMARISEEEYSILTKEFESEKALKEKAKESRRSKRFKKESISIKNIQNEPEQKLNHIVKDTEIKIKVIGKINLDTLNLKTKPDKKIKSKEEQKQVQVVNANEETIDLIHDEDEKKKRPRINVSNNGPTIETPETIVNTQTSLQTMQKKQRLSKVAKEFKISIKIIVQFLKDRGYTIENNPMAIISDELYLLISNECKKSLNPANNNLYTKDVYVETNDNSSNQKNLPENDIVMKPFSETFFVDFSHLEFKTGKVVFKKWFWQVGQSVEFEIINPHIQKEFESIKNYFKNALGIKEIKVEIKAKNQLSFPPVKDIVASSPEIDRIDRNLIDTVRFDFIKKMARSKSLTKSSFTIDKMFESIDDKVKSTTFYTEESQLVEDILSIENKKHYHHLKYLSSNQSTSNKLRFLFKPFSFIFLLEGEENNYIIWETLDTKEATYIWQIEKNMTSFQDNFKKIESIIISLREGGKTKYIENTKDRVLRLYHDYSEPSNGFSKWKLELESIVQ